MLGRDYYSLYYSKVALSNSMAISQLRGLAKTWFPSMSVSFIAAKITVRNGCSTILFYSISPKVQLKTKPHARVPTSLIITIMRKAVAKRWHLFLIPFLCCYFAILKFSFYDFIVFSPRTVNCVAAPALLCQKSLLFLRPQLLTAPLAVQYTHWDVCSFKWTSFKCC